MFSSGFGKSGRIRQNQLFATRLAESLEGALVLGGGGEGGARCIRYSKKGNERLPSKIAKMSKEKIMKGGAG